MLCLFYFTWSIFGTARTECGRLNVTVCRPFVCPSVCPIHPPQQHVVGLLLWAPRVGDMDRLLHGASAAGTAAFQSISTAARRSAANASSVMFTATVGS